MTTEQNQSDIERERLPIDPESNLIQHARTELERIGEDAWMIDHYLQVVQAFANCGHSGYSAHHMLHVLVELLAFKPLSPLTDDPAEWAHHTEEVWGEPGGVWQNRRNGEAFSNDGGKTYYLLSERAASGSAETTPLHRSVAPLTHRGADDEEIPY